LLLLGWRLTALCTARSLSAAPRRCPIAQMCELASRSGRTVVRWAGASRLPDGAAVCTVTAEASRVFLRANDRARAVHQSRSEFRNGSHGRACLRTWSPRALVWDEAHGDPSSANHVLTWAVRVTPRRRRGRPDRDAGRWPGRRALLRSGRRGLAHREREAGSIPRHRADRLFEACPRLEQVLDVGHGRSRPTRRDGRAAWPPTERDRGRPGSGAPSGPRRRLRPDAAATATAPPTPAPGWTATPRPRRRQRGAPDHVTRQRMPHPTATSDTIAHAART
jgi:hypothetical protein